MTSYWRRRKLPSCAATIAICVAISPQLSRGQAASADQDALKQHYDAAATYQRVGDRGRAAAEQRGFLAEALHRIANGEAQSGQFEAAFPHFAEALHFAPQDSQLQIDYATASFDGEKLVQAKTIAEPAAKANPRNAQVRLLLGRILFQLGEYTRAKEELEAAVALNSDFNSGYLLGRIYLLLHDERRARVLFDEMVSGFGNTALLHIYFGKAYSLMDYPDQAIKEFHKAIALDSHAPDAHYFLAMAYMRHDESVGYDSAIPELRAELTINPSDARSHYMLGYIALKQRNFQEAESELGKASALQPNEVNTQVNLAEVYAAQNRAAQGEITLRKAIRLAESDPDGATQAGRAHYLLGRLLMKAGRQDEGKQEMKAAADLDRPVELAAGPAGEPRIISSSAVTVQNDDRAASAAKISSHPDLKKLEDFKKQLSPAIAQTYSDLALNVVSQREFSKAVELFEKARIWNATLPDLDRNLGMAAFEAKEYDKAAGALERQLAAHPDDKTARAAYEEATRHRSVQKNASPSN